MTDGKIGYLHIPDMGSDGIREFNKWFYSQLRKDGLVIDVRSNGGGNVSQMIIERLRRDLLATGFQRGAEMATTYPRTMFNGHLVCILDEDSASDGDIFPYAFRQAGLGPLIGKRSWGGVVGISPRGPLIDTDYHLFQLGALLPERLRPLRIVPDIGLFELALDLGQALRFAIVVKDTPSTHRSVLRGRLSFV